jgi:hypothetical protein
MIFYFSGPPPQKKKVENLPLMDISKGLSEIFTIERYSLLGNAVEWNKIDVYHCRIKFYRLKKHFT